jgi:hypothetical protein
MPRKDLVRGWETECGEDYGKVCIVVRSLYGVKSAGAAFRSSLAQILQDLGYQSVHQGRPRCMVMQGDKGRRF